MTRRRCDTLFWLCFAFVIIAFPAVLVWVGVNGVMR